MEAFNSNSEKTAIGMVIVCVMLILALVTGLYCVGKYFSCNNREVSLRNQAEAQRGVVEANFDAMWKIISQQAQVSNEYKDAFKEIYPDLIAGRYSSGDGSLMKWIQESNPEFDASLYKTLMQTIEVQRIAFSKDQKRMLDIIREHTTLCQTYPNKWFISNSTPIEYTVISSTKSKFAMETGLDDDVDLFKK